MPLVAPCGLGGSLQTKNGVWLDQLDAEIRKALCALPKEELSSNGLFFLGTPARRWFNKMAAIQIMKSRARRDPAHFYGGASILSLGLGLWGRHAVQWYMAGPARGKIKRRRTLKAPLQIETSPSCIHLQRPGSVYMGNLTAARHQVIHDGNTIPGEAFVPNNREECKVTVCLRTDAFADYRARTASSSPEPGKVQEIATAVMVKALRARAMELPTLQECLECHAHLREVASRRECDVGPRLPKQPRPLGSYRRTAAERAGAECRLMGTIG